MTGGARADKVYLFFLPLGVVHYLNGHRPNMCLRADPNRQNRITSDTKIGRPIEDGLSKVQMRHGPRSGATSS
jgi:hypothetical protein